MGIVGMSIWGAFVLFQRLLNFLREKRITDYTLFIHELNQACNVLTDYIICILCLRFLIYVYVYLISNVEMLRSGGYILYISGCLLLFVAMR